MNDEHPWRTAVVLGLAAIVAGMLVSTVVSLALGRGGWTTPGDAWTTMRAAHYIPQGALPLIYETGSGHNVFDSGPLMPLLLAPVAWIGDVFHLQESYPFPRRYPSMWLVYGPYALASAIPLLYAVRALATQLGVRSGRALLQWIVLLLGFVPMAMVYGHYEDVLALALVMLAFRDLFAGKELRGAVCVAVAIAFKQWSLLAVPVYVAACPERVRLRAAVRSIVPPALFFGAFLALDYRWASRALLHPGTYASLGHAALWIPSSTDYVGGVPSRMGAFAVALVAAWAIRNERDPAVVISALGCVFLSRMFFESVVHAYYLAPGIVLLLVAARARHDTGRIVTKVALGAALLLAFPLHPDRWLWWAVAYGLTLALLRDPVLRLVHTERVFGMSRVRRVRVDSSPLS